MSLRNFLAATAAVLLYALSLGASGLANSNPPINDEDNAIPVYVPIERSFFDPLAQMNAQVVSKLRRDISSQRAKTWRWEKYAFWSPTRTSHQERHTDDVTYLHKLDKMWTKRKVKAKRYALSFAYADRYLPAAQARITGQRMAQKLYGWVGQEWSCLDELWGGRESSWYAYSDNPRSSAYGIPQALPGSKMGERWQYSVLVQIKWGLRYIRTHRFFHTPCQAIRYHNAYGSY